MSLLRQIEDHAVDGNSDLETLLRLCRVLASRLAHDDFKGWVQSELDGYRNNAPVPAYRKYSGQCYGNFFGAYGRELHNAPIAESLIPENAREYLVYVDVRQGVAGIKETLRLGGDELRWDWPGDAMRMFGHNSIYNGFSLAQGWVSIPKAFLQDLLSSVRNRILSFALEIEAANPNAGEALPGQQPISQGKVTQMVNNYIYGNVGNMASGEQITQSATITVNQGDFRALAEVLRQHQVEEAEIQKLKPLLKDETPSGPGRFGKRVGGWLGAMLKKSAEGTWNVATTVAADVLTKALNRYYGLEQK